MLIQISKYNSGINTIWFCGVLTLKLLITLRNFICLTTLYDPSPDCIKYINTVQGHSSKYSVHSELYATFHFKCSVFFKNHDIILSVILICCLNHCSPTGQELMGYFLCEWLYIYTISDSYLWQTHCSKNCGLRYVTALFIREQL